MHRLFLVPMTGIGSVDQAQVTSTETPSTEADWSNAGILLVDLSVWLSCANVAALVWHARILARETASASAYATGDSSAARSHFASSATAS